MSTQVSITSGRKVVSVTGTAVPLSTTAEWICGLDVTALSGNAGDIYIGDSTVLNSGSVVGTPEDARDFHSMGIPTNRSLNLATVYINGAAGDGVTFNYFKEV